MSEKGSIYLEIVPASPMRKLSAVLVSLSIAAASTGGFTLSRAGEIQAPAPAILRPPDTVEPERKVVNI